MSKEFIPLPSSTPPPSELEDLYLRHGALAGRLLQVGDPVRAAQVCLGMLEKFSPRPQGTPLRLLVESIFRLLLHERKTLPVQRLREWLSRHPAQQQKCLSLLQKYLASPALDGDRRLLAEMVHAVISQPVIRPASAECGDFPLPGVTRGVYLPLGPQGKAQCRRIYMNLITDENEDTPSLGTHCPGAGIAAARSYLMAAGADIWERASVEVLIEGWFDEIKGESFAVSLAMALISLQLGLPVADEVAFTGALGFSGVPQPDGRDILLLPVDALREKCEAALAAGCRRIYLPKHTEPGSEFCQTLADRGCEVVQVSHLGEIIEDLFPQHARAATPRVATMRDIMHSFRRPNGHPATRLQQMSALTLAAIVFERGFVGEYLVRPHYASLPVALGASGLAAFLVGTTTWYVVDLPRRLPDASPLPPWGTASLLLAGACAGAWGLYHTFMLPPTVLPPPPHNQLWEHPSFQTFKDLSAVALFASMFVLSPAFLVQSAERLQEAGRSRWARELMRNQSKPSISGPISDPKTLAIVGACAIAALLPFDIKSVLPGSKRYGSDSPWQAIHVEIRDLLLSVAAAGFVAWFTGKTTRYSTCSNKTIFSRPSPRSNRQKQ